MITVSDLGLAYSGQPLFSHVDLQFLWHRLFLLYLPYRFPAVPLF